MCDSSIFCKSAYKSNSASASGQHFGCSLGKFADDFLPFSLTMALLCQKEQVAPNAIY